MMMVRKIYSNEELATFKQNMIEYQLFKNMDRAQQAELLKHWGKQFSIPEIAELLEVRDNILYSLRQTLKKQGLIEDGAFITKRRQSKRKQKDKSLDQSEKEVKKAKKEMKKAKKEVAAAIASAPAPESNIIEMDEHIHQPIQQLVPVEYMQQFIDNQVQVVNPAGHDLNVNLEEFMKMLEIQEKMAKMMEEQSKRKNHDGFQFEFKGEFSSQDLSKRLNKILAIIEDEPFKYAVKFELVELEEDAPEKPEQEEVHNELLEEVNSLQESMKEMQKQLEEAKKLDPQKQQTPDWKNGYAALANDKQGLHHPRSEYERNGDFKGKVIKDGKPHYQTFYICNTCGHKGKHYLENGTIYANCQDCGKRMRIRPAVKDELLKQDAFGNYFIAGKFKREDEINQSKSLYEAFNA